MELEVLESKKGTKVVTASNLYLALGLPNHHYGLNIRKWLRDLYEFRDGIRRPEVMRDYAKRPRPGQPVDDFYIAIELAKLIVLRTSSREKLRLARYLDMASNNGQLTLFSQAA